MVTGATGENASDAAEATGGSRGRRLSELRVPELRAELERRGLDRHGVKAQLVERLQQAVKDEGRNPDECVFPDDAAAKRRRDEDAPIEDVNMDNLVVKDEIAGEEEEEEAAAPPPAASATPAAPAAPPPRKREPAADAAADDEAPRPKRIRDDDKAEEVEDSINLDIGEDDFLNEEGEAAAVKTGVARTRTPVRAADPEKETARADGEPRRRGPEEEAREPPADVRVIKAEGSDAEPRSADADPDNDSTVTDADKEKEEKETKKSVSGLLSRNLWVSGLSGSTRANDLKQLCSRHGKVIGAKVVTNARTPGSRCYGYVTMASAEDAQNCIKHLHRTELHGRQISMERAKSDSTATSGANGAGNSTPSKGGRVPPQPQRSPRRPVSVKDKSEDGSGDKMKDASTKDGKKDEDSENTAKDDESKSKEKEVSKKSDSGVETGNDDSRKENRKASSHDSKSKDDKTDRAKLDRARHRKLTPASKDFLSFSKIKKEREAQRTREHIRKARSEERRRRAAEQTLRDLERRQRAEKHRQRVEKDRIALEREKLRIERERIEREKLELHRIERERQKLERERLELERLELKRAQMRLEEERGRAAAKHNSYLYNSSTRSSSALISRSKQPIPPPPPSYDRPSGRSGESGGGSNPARFTMPMPPSHMSVSAPSYEMSSSSSSNKPPDRGMPSRERPRERDRSRDFKRDYPPAPRHTSSSHTGGSSTGMKYTSNGGPYEPRQPLPPGTRPREQRYGGGMETGDSRGNSGTSLRDRPLTSSNHERSGGSSSTSYRPNESSHRSPKPTSRDHRYSDSSSAMKGDSWTTGGGGGESSGRYGNSVSSGGGQYAETRYATYQPAPPGSNSFQDIVRYPVMRDFRQKY